MRRSTRERLVGLIEPIEPDGRRTLQILKSRCPLLVGLAFSIGAIGIAAQSLDAVPMVLGEFPLCEGSAAVWPGGDHLLVGDNEVRETLFAFSLSNGRLDPRQSIEHSLGDDVEISDIEALAGLQSGEVVVFGSHSRNTRCRARGNRRRFLRGRLTADGFVASSDGVVRMNKKISCDALFGHISDNKPLLASVCERVDAVEQTADKIWDSEDSDEDKVEACNEAQPFNAEGAVAISDAAGEAVWVGLRSPLLPPASVGGGNDMAILLRMKDLDDYTFDAAALVDLGGTGIRELAVHNGWVFGIAGPAEDSRVDFRLWKVPVGELLPAATLTPTFIESLPTSAEGLAIVDSTAHVIIDGDRDDDRCVEPARHLELPLLR